MRISETKKDMESGGNSSYGRARAGESAVPRIAPADKLPSGVDSGGLFDGLFDGRPSLNVLRTLARNPALLAAVFPLVQQVAGGVLPPRDREVIILRVAARRRSPYMWAHHHRGGLDAGLTREELQAIGRTDFGGVTDFDATLIRSVDELCDAGAISEQVWRLLVEKYDDGQILELLGLAGTYTMIAFVLNTCQVPIDPWLPDPAPLEPMER